MTAPCACTPRGEIEYSGEQTKHKGRPHPHGEANRKQAFEEAITDIHIRKVYAHDLVGVVLIPAFVGKRSCWKPSPLHVYIYRKH